MNKALAKLKLKVKEKKIKIKGARAQDIERSLSTLEFNTTYNYIRLNPSTKEEEGIIKSDSTLFVFDYPLDFEFTDDYLDNRPTPTDSIFEYYTAVPIGQTLPSGVEVEVIENLYIPEEDPFFDGKYVDDEFIDSPETRQGEIANNEDFLRHLLYEAYELTDNLPDLIGDVTPDEAQGQRWIFGSKWNPSGTLRLWDDNAGISLSRERILPYYEYYPCEDGEVGLEPDPGQRIPEDGMCARDVYNYKDVKIQGKFVPLEGAQVLMRQWFTIRQGITDANGNFSTKSVRGKARYILQWERYHYSIRNGSLFQAETRGPKVEEERWVRDIKGGDDEYHGMIHTAAHEYYYGNRLGLYSPPKNGALRKQIKIAAREQNGVSSHIHQRRFIHLAQIHIKQWGEQSQYVYGTTIHELAHAAHWNLDRVAYNHLGEEGYVFGNDGDKRTLETWASTVEITMTNNRYKNKFFQSNFSFKNELQQQKIKDENFYTSAGLDMMDSYNQRELGLDYPQDRVKGYSLNELESGLIGAESWQQWKDNIKQRNSNPTSGFLDELFNNWR